MMTRPVRPDSIGDSVECDVRQFEGLLANTPLAAADTRNGIILKGFEFPDQEFNDWLRQKRGHYDNALADKLRAKAAKALESGDVDDESVAARMLTEIDP